MRSAAAVSLLLPSFVQLLIGIFGIFRPNALVLLPSLTLVAFLCLTVAIGIASYHYEQTTGGAWKWLFLAAVAQVLAFLPQPLH
jgi:hypothetical protein